MRKPKGIYLLALLTALMGADHDYARLRRGLVVMSALPECAEDEYFVYTTNGLACTTIPSRPPVVLPDCKTSGQLLTYTETGGVAVYGCTDPGTESVTPADIASINSIYQQLVSQEVSIRNLEMGMRTTFHVYCGQTASQPSAAFVDGTASGIAAAARLCGRVAGCSSGAHMCSVYEMYRSVVTGAIGSADVGKSWVYQASWSQEFSDSSGTQKEPGAGLADNCGGFTVGDSAKKWYGTAVQWTLADSGQKALKFYSGPPNVGVPGTTTIVANPGAVACDSVLPIACCN